ncbi:DUF3598 family protein [Gloeothece verrucosa]|uniref:Uncharacterized protein n=1 Tax=Gloeothece verrucosa (strain PCC 7822) TaxID=497965 RepID=E0UJZ5_GLOV7|nr:DUF3598 family protein [Gloeothece verrucosa]ADN14631.1 conserved hypothetical protein [Gloeothece verrucosa PCC 7822]
MELKQQNWNNFIANHLSNWHGIWTRYSPQGEITESFQSLRGFCANPEQNEITQTNRYQYADGKILEKTWKFDQQSNNLSDGLFHPDNELMRGIFFSSGPAAWITTQLALDSYLAVELFFKQEKLRHSVGIIYDKQGNLFRTANIREDATGFPSQYWSTQLEQLPQRSDSGNWQGTSVTMTRDLNISDPIPTGGPNEFRTELHWGWKDHQVFFLPDGVSISCPDKISLGKSFVIAASWLVTSSQKQQLIVEYDESGAFCSLTLELLESVFEKLSNK